MYSVPPHATINKVEQGSMVGPDHNIIERKPLMTSVTIIGICMKGLVIQGLYEDKPAFTIVRPDVFVYWQALEEKPDLLRFVGEPTINQSANTYWARSLNTIT